MKKLLLIAIPLLLFSCKKNKISKIEREYLCVVTTNYSYSGNIQKTEYDHLISPTVTDDIIVFDGFEFPLSEYNRRTGSGSHSLTEQNTTAKLTFSNGFKELSFVKSTSVANSPTSTKTIIGSYSNVDTAVDQSGTYNLTIQSYDTENSIDTMYSGVLNVSYNALTQQLDIGNETYSIPNFYSYYHSSSRQNTGIYYDEVNELSWSNNTISFCNFSSIVSPGSNNGDTTLILYQGVKQ